MVRLSDIFLLGLLVLSSYINLCSGRYNPNRNVISIPASVNEFSSNFYEKFAERHKGNFVFSPLSVYLTLMMAAQGAGGRTRAELESLLHLSSTSNYNQDFKDLLDNLNNAEGVEFGLAHKLYMNVREINSTFKDVLATYFKSEPSRFSTETADSLLKAVHEINDWCANKTNGLIKNIVASADLEKSKFFLLNALHFKGEWIYQFDKTEGRPFHVNGADHPVPVEMMVMSPGSDSAEVNYYTSEELDAEFIELPYRIRQYSHNYSCSMFVFRPRKVDGLAKLEANMEKLNFTNLPTPQLRSIRAILPKFTVASSLDVGQDLKEMGMTESFDTDEADFSKIADEHLVIDSIKQSAFIDVNKYGTEGAAATIVGVTKLSSETSSYEYNVDRPFLAVIVYKNTGIPVFYIRVKDLPVYNETETATPKE